MEGDSGFWEFTCVSAERSKTSMANSYDIGISGSNSVCGIVLEASQEGCISGTGYPFCGLNFPLIALIVTLNDLLRL